MRQVIVQNDTSRKSARYEEIDDYWHIQVIS